MRQYSTELLHRLLETTSWPNGPDLEKDREIIDSATSVFSEDFSVKKMMKGKEIEFSSGNIRYNTTVAIDFSRCNIGKEFRQTVEDSLETFIKNTDASGNMPKTTELIEETIPNFNTCPP